ncbi:MAG: nucleotidyl transferase AbiEii/AbiGii toxin family protein [Balneolaceae bacterium]
MSDLRQEQLRELIQVTEQVFSECGVDFYLLGAIARDAWYAKEQIRSRATRDVDFALYVSGKEQYDEVVRQLITNHDFSEIERVPFRLQSPFGATIDLIPFGEISIDNAVQPDGTWDRPVFVNGFGEIHQLATVLFQAEEDGLQFRVATLPAIIVLKLIAYDDRPENRVQDPQDIAEIIVNYFDIEREMIWEHHSDLFDDDIELEEIACIVIGREIKKILGQNRMLRDRVVQMLSFEHATQRSMVRVMARGERTLDEITYWFTLIKKEID